MSTWEALADPTRRAIVRHLAGGELTAGEIAGQFDTSRPGVSRHLRVLRAAGVVECRAAAQQRVYRLAPLALDEVESWCRAVRSFWNQRLDAIDTEIVRGQRDRAEEKT